MGADDDILCTLWVIYDHPRDFPEWFVVRRQFIKRGATDTHWVRRPRPSHHAGSTVVVLDRYAILSETLIEARAAVQDGARAMGCAPAVFIGREPNDDPRIVEVWV